MLREQLFEERIKFFEYLKRLSPLVGLFFYTIHDEKKNGTTSLRENSFSHTVKAILPESPLVSYVIRVLKSQIKNKMNPAEF